MKRFLTFFILSTIVGTTLFMTYRGFISFNYSQNVYPGDIQNKTEEFITPINANTASIALALYNQGYIHSVWEFVAFKVMTFFSNTIQSGAYLLSKNMSVFELYQNLASPFAHSVYIPAGLRKEEIAEKFAKTLKWDDEEKSAFLATGTLSDKTIADGYFFPGTYLVPIGDSAENVSKKMIEAFQKNVQDPYEAKNKNVVNLNTLLVIASMIEREAGKGDMKLISGIIWNRLFAGWPLQIDATLQYVKGSTENGWWPRVVPNDRNAESPYNTYINKGLPPTPIANPSLAAIDAALHPAKTKCFFYLHDQNSQIHCSTTYAGHEKNIDRFYRNNVALKKKILE